MYGVRVGVWLMPDNRRIGALEDFLQDLIDDSDVLLPHARESTARAKAKGARFPDKDSKKALVHTWLAWQEEPGRPYGVAIKARYLRDDSDAAERFVAVVRACVRTDGGASATELTSARQDARILRTEFGVDG